jgi:corrinoid protein of di/trimethylamine methyltransferase
MSIYSDISQNLQRGRAKIVAQYVQQAIDEGLPAQEILDQGLLDGMNIIGVKFKNNEIYVPEVMIAARAMNAGTALLKPLLAASGQKAAGRVCIGTVKGDMHDIGKNLVKMMMEGKGLEVIDLGTDVSPQKFLDTVINENCDIVACSALLTTTMGVMREVVETFENNGKRGNVKIMIGGAPVTQEFCDEIGADSYTPDAASAAEVAAAFCEH